VRGCEEERRALTVDGNTSQLGVSREILLVIPGP
jgi:hypothetical protein